MTVAHGFYAEYGDTATRSGPLAREALVAWVPAYVIVGLLVGAALLVGRTRAVALTGAALVVATAVAVPVAAVQGVQAKRDRYEATPGCDGDTDAGPLSGPAKKVLERAEAEFAALEHPGPFTGGGSSGLDGCESYLDLYEDTDPRPAYQDALPDAGWTDVTLDHGVLRATKGDQGFRLRHREAGWTVWIGPQGGTS